MKNFRFSRFLAVSVLFLLMLLGASPAFAGVIPVTQAKAKAEGFLKEVAPARSPKLQLMFESPRMTKGGLAEPEYFIFADEQGGYVIAAGDDTVPSILGYSTTGTIQTDAMPENLRSWLDMWSEIVASERLGGAAPYPQAARTSGGTSKLLKTALWDQGAPFNRHCIEMNGEHALTGCGPTAMAILTRYLKWPEKGKGTVPSYKCTYRGGTYTVPSVKLGHTYDWDNMPISKYDGTWTLKQIEEVSVLMRDLGTMVQAQYSPEGTSAYMEDIGPALVKYMDYDKGYRHERKMFYPDVEEWIALLKASIDEDCPVLYGGHAPAYGHAFILDGYDKNDYFHINWGWSGSGNGYFAMPNFSEFTLSHTALLDIKKNAGGNYQDDIAIYRSGLRASLRRFVVGESFTVTCKYVGNYGTRPFNGEVAFAKFDSSGTMEELVSDSTPLYINKGEGEEVSDVVCVVNTPIKDGDVVRLIYRSSRTPSWTPVRYDSENGAVGVIPLTGPSLPLEEAVSLSYDACSGILTVSFQEEVTYELKKGAKVVLSGTSELDEKVSIDANQLAPASYALHLKIGEQEKTIKIKFGLKK